MKKPTILSSTQLLFLKLFGKHPLSRKFYLTGGTALSEFYIPYRYSEDLDFFSLEEIQTDEIITFIKSLKNGLGFKSFDFNTSFNRNLFFLKFPKKVLKLEFTYYPFAQIDSSREESGVKIDSVLDIAVNKIFTIYQNPRSRDFIDLYIIITKYGFSFEDLIKKAKVKFDWHIDPIKLGSQLLMVGEVKDYPRLITKIDEKEWKNFFKKKAKELKKDIIEASS